MNQDEARQNAEKAIAWYRDHKKITEYVAIFIFGLIVASCVFR